MMERMFDLAFNTASFLFFLFPPLFLLYALVPGRRGKNAFLLIASLIFYAAGQWQGLPFLLLAALLSWAAGVLIPRVRAKRALLALVLTLDLSILGVFKYLNFLTGIVNSLTGLRLPEADLLLPVGISFFIFKAMAYAVDVCRNEYAAARRFSDVLLYISFFPQVTSGPISRFGAFAVQLEERTPLSAVQSARGLRRFTVGFAKKTLIAGLAAPLADAAFSLGAGLDCRLAWLGAAAYTIQIYFDFSGYSDMAIGLGHMLGFHTPENFQYPYISASITEFWRRWHISLSSWFRDYLYIPLGGGRWGTPRKCLNKAVVFLLCGLWHGASWTFVLWGVWHGLLSAAESALPLRRWQRHWPVRLLGHVYTLLAVCLGFVMFRAAMVGEAVTVFRAMFTGGVTAASTLVLERISLAAWFALAAGAVCSTPLGSWLWQKLSGRTWAAALSYLAAAGLFVLCLLAMAGGGFRPFIYFQF